MARDDSFQERGLSFNDNEKINEKDANESVDLTSDLPGDVYDDGRAIDLGANGKERPIGNVYYILALSGIHLLIPPRDRHRRCDTFNISRRRSLAASIYLSTMVSWSWSILLRRRTRPNLREQTSSSSIPQLTHALLISTSGLKLSTLALFSFKSYHTYWASLWRKLSLDPSILVLQPETQPFGDSWTPDHSVSPTISFYLYI